MSEHVLYYDLSPKAEAAFAESVDDAFVYLIEHYHQSLGRAGIFRSEHSTKGGRSISIVTDPEMRLTVIYLREELAA
jgi:hypothetical protein